MKTTRTLVVSKKISVTDASILIAGTPIGQVTSMIYLGHMVTDDGKVIRK